MNYLKISLGIFIVLASSRFVPHPPNFTSLIALSFYVPAILGTIYIPSIILSFIITDLFLGFHSTIFFTWGSIVLIGIFSKFFIRSYTKRLVGSLLGCITFFIITNLGVWLNGSYGYSFDGLVLCYTLALPFFFYTIISTLIFSNIIELVIFVFKKKGLYKFD